MPMWEQTGAPGCERVGTHRQDPGTASAERQVASRRPEAASRAPEAASAEHRSAPAEQRSAPARARAGRAVAPPRARASGTAAGSPLPTQWAPRKPQAGPASRALVERDLPGSVRRGSPCVPSGAAPPARAPTRTSSAPAGAEAAAAGSACHPQPRPSEPAPSAGCRTPTRRRHRSSRTSPGARAWAPVARARSGRPPPAPLRRRSPRARRTTTRARRPASGDPAPAGCSPPAASASGPRSRTLQADHASSSARRAGLPYATAWPRAAVAHPGPCLTLCPRVTAFGARTCDRVGLGQEPTPVGVLEIEDCVQRPVEVIRESGRLPEQLLG